jgi:hypothetical protein
MVFLYHVFLLMVFLGFKLNVPFYLHRSLQKMAKFYQRQKLNPQSSLFHYGLIRILVVSHLSKTGDSWGNFLFRNNFTLPKNEIESPLHLNENPNPYRSNPTIENICVNLQEDHVSTRSNLCFYSKSIGNEATMQFHAQKFIGIGFRCVKRQDSYCSYS